MNCLFCSKPEKSYSPGVGIDFICGPCVQILFSSEQDFLRQAHAKALEKGYLNKARAIESFIIPEVKDGKRPATKSVKRSPDRKRTVRNVRPQERTVRQIEDKQPTTFL